MQQAHMWLFLHLCSGRTSPTLLSFASRFGDRVKHWVRFNEPNIMVKFAYFVRVFPPNHCSEPYGKCDSGNSSTGPYIAAHNMILAHAKAVNIYRKYYKVQQTHLDKKGVGTNRVLALKSSWKLYKLFSLFSILLRPSKVALLEFHYIWDGMNHWGISQRTTWQ